MADLANIDTTVLPGHVVRAVHALARDRALRGYYVTSGGHVGQKGAGANMSVDVDAIDYFLDGDETDLVTLTNVVIGTSHATLPRIDILSISDAGVMTITPGTVHLVVPTGETVFQKFALPCPPTMSGIEGIILAEIYVPAAVTTILDAYIRMLGVPISIVAGGGGAGDVIGPDHNTDGNVPAYDGTDSNTLKDGYGVSIAIGTPGVNTKLASEKAVRDVIVPTCTTVGTPGSDLQVPTEQAVRENLPTYVTTIGDPGSNNNTPTEAAVRSALTPLITSLGDPGSDSNAVSEKAIRTAINAISPGGGLAFWGAFPGTPTRVSDTSFSVTDTANAHLYDKMFGASTIICWEKSGGGWQAAKIKSATYSSNAVTYVIAGNTLAAAFTGMKYCVHPVMTKVIRVPNNLPTAAETNIDAFFAEYDMYVFSALVKYRTAATTTKGVWDVNDDGTSIFTTKPEIAAAAKVGTETVCDSLLGTATTIVAKDSEISLDYDSGHATTPGADAYIYLSVMPASWRYRS